MTESWTGLGRFTVGRKVIAGLMVIVALGLLSMSVIYRDLNTVGGAVNRLAQVEEPLNAAAYEMEVNVNGIGLAVLKFLATGQAEYRDWAAQDNADFARYHATYQKLVVSDREKQLAAEIADYYVRFWELGSMLMRKRAEQEKLLVAVTDGIERIDRVIDGDMSDTRRRAASSSRVGYEKALVAANMEAEIAEVGFWLATYQRVHTRQARDTIFSKMADFEREMGQFLGLPLDAQERSSVAAIQSIYAGMVQQVQTVVSLEAEIRDERTRFIGLRVTMDGLLDNEIQVLLSRGLDVPRQQADAAVGHAIVMMRYLVPLFLLAAVLVGYVVLRSLTVPLSRLRRGTEAVGDGKLEHRIASSANDEFGDVARAFNQMVTQLQETTVSKHLLAGSEEKLRQTVVDLRHQIAERERAENDREALQAKLRRTETMSAMGSLVAAVAHEVRNPLFGISSTLDAMDARLGERPEYGRYREVLRSEVSRLGKLMSDLLNFGKPAAEPFVQGRLGDVVDQAVAANKSLAVSCGVHIDNRLPAALPGMLLAHNRLVQVFVNLIENALQHSLRGSTVLLEARQIDEDGCLWIECGVRDAGIGIRAEDLPMLFDPFFTRRRGGTGLGLSIVQRIVEEHGGRVSANNHRDGGVLMTVRLPVNPD